MLDLSKNKFTHEALAYILPCCPSPAKDSETNEVNDDTETCSQTGYLEGWGDLVSRLIPRITRVTIWVIGVMNLVTKSP